METKSLSHFFLHCHYFTNKYASLFSKLNSLNINIRTFSDKIRELLLYGSTTFDSNQNYFMEWVKLIDNKPAFLFNLSILWDSMWDEVDVYTKKQKFCTGPIMFFYYKLVFLWYWTIKNNAHCWKRIIGPKWILIMDSDRFL